MATKQSQRIRLLPDSFFDYDFNGYNFFHFNKQGINEFTGTKYDEDGYDQYGYNRDGIDRAGFNEEGINIKTHDYFDENGLDEWGFNRKGEYISENKSHMPHGNSYDYAPLSEGSKDAKNEFDSYNYWGYPRYLCCEFSSKGIHKITKTPYNQYGINWQGYNEEGEFIGNYKVINDILSQIKKIEMEDIRYENEKKEQEKKLQSIQEEKEKTENTIKQGKAQFGIDNIAEAIKERKKQLKDSTNRGKNPFAGKLGGKIQVNINENIKKIHQEIEQLQELSNLENNLSDLKNHEKDGNQKLNNIRATLSEHAQRKNNLKKDLSLKQSECKKFVELLFSK